MDDESSGVTFASLANGLVNALVRVTGLVLLGIGMWTAVNLLEEVWALYRDPARPTVEHFAQAIESASHVDKLLTPKHVAGAEDTAAAAADAAGTSTDTKTAAPAAKAEETFRFSYFIAWPIVLLMLLLIGRLALAAIKIGGELALYDVQIKRFAAGLLREVARDR